MFITISLASILIVVFVRWFYWRNKVIKYMKKFNGPTPLPIIGNGLEFLSHSELIPRLMKLVESYGPVVKLWIGPTPSILLIRDPKLLEVILNSKKTHAKSSEYTYLKDWIGEGLLSNKGGPRWVKHRKIIAPSFYYNILEQFIPVFTSVCANLVRKLETEIGNPSYDISTVMKLYSLDTICECVMGTQLNALEDPNCDFLQHVTNVAETIIRRTFNPLIKPDLLFRFTELYRRSTKSFRKLGEIADNVIISRKTQKQNCEKSVNFDNGINEYGQKRRLAFLDLLLEAAAKDPSFTNDHIKEEVATFMFAGQDTTQVALIFCLYSLANNQNVQEKVVEELHDIFGNDRDIHVTLNDINNMKYMEAVIKETLRLYPPVPVVGRETTEDLEYDGTIIPKGISLLMFVLALHRDPSLYSDPLTFDPERFITGEAPLPYTYMPFSIGARDCIGRKFAMLLMKLTLATLLRKFEFHPATPKHELLLVNNVVLTSLTGVCVEIRKRDFKM